MTGLSESMYYELAKALYPMVLNGEWGQIDAIFDAWTVSEDTINETVLALMATHPARKHLSSRTKVLEEFRTLDNEEAKSCLRYLHV